MANRFSRILICVCAGVAASLQTFDAVPASNLTVPAPDDYARAARNDWPLVGGDWGNSRYSELTQINSDNVGQLGLAWTSMRFEDGGISKATPVVKDGLMFITAGQQVYALDVRTGERVWRYNTVHNAKVSGPQSVEEVSKEVEQSRSGVPNGKGVGIGQGLVFVGLKDGRVVALKQRTGELVWAQQTGVDAPKTGQWAAVAPTYSNGVVFTGLSNGDANLRGRLLALDAGTGQMLWHMFAIPGPGEAGHDTWPQFNDSWKFGGGGVWTNPAVDPELGLAYFTTGNPVPAFAGDLRPGKNLYTCSVLAIDIKTGKLKWYYQVLRHDVFEGDLGTPVILYDAVTSHGTTRALAVLRADGHLFQLHRETGKPILPVKELRVPQLRSQKTSSTQPFPVGGESFLMGCEDWKREGVPAGFVVGCMWTPPAAPPPSRDPPNILAPFPSVRGSPMAYSPQTGYFYVQGTSMLTWPRRGLDPYFLNFVGNIPGLKSYGELAALDGRTGKIAWRHTIPVASLGGGPMVTAGGLIFRSTGDGRLEARHATTGNLLWQFPTGMAGGGPAASYELDGEQHIAVAMGSAVLTFKLGGTGPKIVASAPITSREFFFGPLVDTEIIETTSLHRTVLDPGKRYFVDEYTFNPYRARVKAGVTVLFANNGNMRHEVVAADGSWTTGPLSPTQEAWITFDTPGEHAYTCKDHPWSHGQIIVQSADEALPKQEGERAKDAGTIGTGFVNQALQGKSLFDEHCKACHGDNLSGALAKRWRHASVADLFDSIRTMMPQPKPGSLTRKAYLDIVAYLMKVNDLTSRRDGLVDDPQVLRETFVREESYVQ